jgi:hypothetical protein
MIQLGTIWDSGARPDEEPCGRCDEQGASDHRR